MREKSFTYETYLSIQKDKNLSLEILNNAKILKEIEGKLLKKRDFYTNQKEDKLYYVNDYSARPFKIDVIPVFSKTGVRGTDKITIGDFEQKIKVLDVKRLK